MKYGLLFSAVLGLSTSVAGSELRDDVMVLMYETDESLQHDSKSPLNFFKQRAQAAHLQATVFGGNLAYHGFGDKYQTLKPLLEVADKDKLVILADARDVVLNVPDNEAFASLAVDNFVETYKKLTLDAPNAVVMSAEAQCCVSAMAHAHPSEYFDPITKERKSRACASGQPGCLWFKSENIEDWQIFMEDLALKTTGEDLSDVYLNAGLMVGYPDDLINLLNVLDIDPSEDDQAVLTGLMYHFPDMIKLDYRQEMFGNNQWPRGLVDGCVFEPQGEHLPLIHTETRTEPLILHTPGKFYDCLDVLIEDLGGVSQQRYLLGLEQLDKVAMNMGFAVSSERGEYSHRRDLSEHRRKLAFFSRVFEMVYRMKAKVEEERPFSGRTMGIEKKVSSSNYGVASNYGVHYGLSSDESSAPDNYGNYGVSNYGNYGIRRHRRRTVF